MKNKALKLTYVILLSTLTSFISKAQFRHNGPAYFLPSNVERDPGSSTSDNARGLASPDNRYRYIVTWYDRYNKIHSVGVDPGQQMTVVFPIPAGGEWIWTEASQKQQRTGFNNAVTWVEATFRQEGDHIRIRSTGYRVGPSDPNFLEEAKKQGETAYDIARNGAATLGEVATILKIIVQ